MNEAVLSNAVRRAVVELRDALGARFSDRLREVTLFGSQARGEADEDSDVDVLVVIDALTENERDAVVRLAYDVDRASDDWLGMSVLCLSTEHASDMRRRERLLMREVDREGIPM